MKRNSLRMLAFSVTFAALSACTTEPKVKDPVLVLPPKETVDIPAYLLVNCPMIDKLEERPYFEAELVPLMTKIITRSEECRTKNSILINTLSNALNLKPVVQTPSK